MSQEKNYAFEKLKEVLYQEDCKGIVVADMIEKFNLSFEDAVNYVEEAFEIWVDAYTE